MLFEWPRHGFHEHNQHARRTSWFYRSPPKPSQSISKLGHIPTNGPLSQHYDIGELTIGGIEVEHLVLEVQFFVTVERQKIISKFELKGPRMLLFIRPHSECSSREAIAD